jgi:signal transduction histidine kinase
VTWWSECRRGRFWAEIVLSVVVGVVAFVIAAAVSTAARSHVPTAVLGLLLLAAVLAVARFAGILYALPVGIVTIEAFDWYFLPPLRNLDGNTVLILGLFLAVAVIVGGFATLAVRRAVRSEQALGVLAEEQAALRRVATLVATGAATAEVFAAVAHEVSEVMQLPVAVVQRYEDGNSMTVTATWCDRPHPFHPGTTWSYHPAGMAAHVRRTGRPARVEDYQHRPSPFGAAVQRLGVTSAAAAPVIVDGAVWGLVTVASTEEPVPDGTEERLAKFTGLVGTAVANTQSRAELSASRVRIVAAADETRRRIERDLHDGIQQQLVSLALKARAIEEMPPEQADRIRGELSLLAEGLGNAMDELREIAQGIHPAILSESGLGSALEALARRSAVPVELNVDLRSRLGKHVEATGYYIVSEAITNVAKHAEASVIEILAEGRADGLTLSVSDDGAGGAEPGRGSGIVGLKDRVEALGGTIAVVSPRGQGTTLSVWLPAGPPPGAAAPDGIPPAERT